MKNILEKYGRAHPRLMLLANALLMAFVALVLLTTTDAPVVLYQAF